MKAYLNRSRFLYLEEIDRNPPVLMMPLDDAIDEMNRRRERDVEMHQL